MVETNKLTNHNGMNEGMKGKEQNRQAVRDITVTGAFIAMTLLFTAFVNVKLPFGYGGLIHLGNIPLLLAALLYGRKTGCLAGAFGMALFDILSSWTIYAPCTFLVCGLMGYVVGRIAEHHTGKGYHILACGIALLIKLSGYYLFEAILYHNWIEPLASVPGNTLQVVFATFIVMMVYQPIYGALLKMGMLPRTEG